MTQAPRTAGIGARFGAAAPAYENHASVQRQAAARLAGDIALLPLPSRPRILEIGCGTGLLTQALARRIGPADWPVPTSLPACSRPRRAAPHCQARPAINCWTASTPRGSKAATT
ncbi:hypothetical protein [Achromobacter aegrifaciens]|uniref:hypothetical protein n=1 Tax=Achromobacter aegrifaciens TaxID=1287736 RepID=UPI001FCBED41|nr:hypothetical protein [Achromobacter aegrifaciens]